MLGKTSDGELLLGIGELETMTLQMKIHLQTSALAYELWCSVKRTLVASDEMQVTVMQKSVVYGKTEVAKCCRHLLQTC